MRSCISKTVGGWYIRHLANFMLILFIMLSMTHFVTKGIHCSAPHCKHSCLVTKHSTKTTGLLSILHSIWEHHQRLWTWQRRAWISTSTKSQTWLKIWLSWTVILNCWLQIMWSPKDMTRAFLIQGSTYINKDSVTASKELFVLNPLRHDNIDVGGYVLFEPITEHAKSTSKQVLIECFEPRVTRAKLYFHVHIQDLVLL